MGVLFITYSVNWDINDPEGDGDPIYDNYLLSGWKYWNTDYEESNYGIDSYDTNLIFQW